MAEGFETIQIGDWKVMKVSDNLVIFRNMVTDESGEIHVVDGSVDWYDGMHELPDDVYRCLVKLDIGSDSDA